MLHARLPSQSLLVAATALTITALLALVPPEAHALDTASPTAWVANGPVRTIVPDGSGRFYVGGDFRSFGPRLGHGLRFTLDSDAPAGGLPDINGTVLASVADGAGGEFIGGTFTSVGGVERKRLAHIRADGTLDPNWNPTASNTVRALALSGSDLFVGGDFSGAGAIGGFAQNRLAKLSAATGAVDASWTTHTDGSVRTLAVSGADLYVGGAFSSVLNANSNVSARVAKVSTAGAGDVDSTWQPGGDATRIDALAVSGADLYIAGVFSSIGGKSRSGLAKLQSGSTGTADATWDPSPSANVNALVLSGSDLFVGGIFNTIGGQTRHSVAKLSTTGTGAADATWDPSVYGTVESLAISGSTLIIGGAHYGTANTVLEHDNLTAVSTTGAGAASAWNPQPNGTVRTITVSGSHVFAGGDITSGGPSLTVTGALVRLNADGTLDSSWAPQIDPGAVKAIAFDGTYVYAGGDFGSVRGQTHLELAKIPAAGNGSADATWVPAPNGPIATLALSGSDLYVAGDFTGATSIGGQTRNHLAKLTTGGTGSADATWDPNPTGLVFAFALSGSDLFVGGSFNNIGGQPRQSAAKLATTGTGAADATWDPSFAGAVNTLAVSGSALYAGGDFVNVGGTTRRKLARVATDGAGALDPWNPGADAAVNALTVSGDVLYVGGAFTQFGGGFGSIPTAKRNHLGRFSLASGDLDPGFDLPPSTNGGGVNAVVAVPSAILVGGDFDSVGNLSTSYFTLFDLQPPTIDVTVPSDGARYRQGQVVNAAFSCADPSSPSGLSCVGPVQAGAPIDTASVGTRTFTVTATDSGGNSVAKTVSYFVDGSAPAITIAQPAAGASYAVGSKVNAAYSCDDPDGAADVASCAGPVAVGAPIDTSSAGTRTFTVTSADAVGNTATKSVSYSVTTTAVPPPTPVTPRPIISALKIVPAAFRAAPKGATTSAKKVPIGGKVSYRLSVAAIVTFKVTARKGKKTITAGTFKLNGKPGVNKFTFRGRLKKKPLKPGKYRLVAQATGATGLRSVTVARSFRIVKTSAASARTSSARRRAA